MKKNAIKMGLVAVCLSWATVSTAQQTTGDIDRETVINPGQAVGANDDGAVKVIDNKGNIKYLQVKNGLTTLANTTSDVTTVTWQLGGTLSDSTTLALDGLKLIDLDVDSASMNAQDESSGDGTTGGFTLIVRDEATGELKKMSAADLIASGHEKFDVLLNGESDFTLTGDPTLPSFNTVWVYRNGAKLISGLDYTVSGSTVSLVFPVNGE
jgi:hypothetical protein